MENLLNMLIPFVLILPLGLFVFLTPPPPDDYLADDDPDAPVWFPPHALGVPLARYSRTVKGA